MYSLGIDPQGPEWMNLYRRLFPWGGKQVRGGDQSQYDGNVFNQFTTALCECVNKFYGDSEENQTVRRVLFHEMNHCVHLFFNAPFGVWVVYMTTHGNPSGNVFTTVLNSFVNACYMRMAYLEIAILNPTVPRDLISMAAYSKNVTEAYFGDDDVGESAPNIAWFNMANIALILRSHGLTYTSNQKDGRMIPFETVDTVKYLKRGFLPDEDYPTIIMRAPLDEAPIQELINWIKTSDDPLGALQSNVDDFQRYYSAYGREKFNQESLRVELVALSLELPLQFRGYEYYRFETEVAHGIAYRAYQLSAIHSMLGGEDNEMDPNENNIFAIPSITNSILGPECLEDIPSFQYGEDSLPISGYA